MYRRAAVDTVDPTGRLNCLVGLSHVLGCDPEELRQLRWADVALPEASSTPARFGVTHTQLQARHIELDEAMRWGAIHRPDPAGSGQETWQPLGIVGWGALDRYLRRRASSPLPAHSVYVFPDLVRGAAPLSRRSLRSLLRRVAQSEAA